MLWVVEKIILQRWENMLDRFNPSGPKLKRVLEPRPGRVAQKEKMKTARKNFFWTANVASQASPDKSLKLTRGGAANPLSRATSSPPVQLNSHPLGLL